MRFIKLLFFIIGVPLLFMDTAPVDAVCRQLTTTARNEIYASVVTLSVEPENGTTRTGSGVIISSDGYIITNQHVVDGAQRITVSMYTDDSTPPTQRYRASIVDNSALDIAIIKIDRTSSGGALPSNFRVNPIDRFATIENGDSIRIISYPLMGRRTISNTTGEITGINTVRIGRFNASELLTDAVFGSSGSGGLVINCDGEMVGVPSTISPDISNGYLSVIIPISTICSVDRFICERYSIGTTNSSNNNASATTSSNNNATATTGCPNNGLPPRLVVGDRGRVTPVPALANRVRRSPGTGGDIIDTIQPRTVFDVISGPVCANNINWWYIQVDNLTGWTAEGTNGQYFTEPWN